ncbi:MAG: ribose 5-phosphate isomerase B [Eubacteriales bacterium]|nr:ribose 5-phosphate isomerase B [Eubacteriales bacterium]
MTIALGSDHGGYQLKLQILKFLKDSGYKFHDFGVYSDEKRVDYAEYALVVAEAVKSGEYERGIVLCGTGIGISIAANKIPGIRAAVCTDTFMARMSREHNDANVLALGGRVIGAGLALDIVKIWLETEFSGDERHVNRINKLKNIEGKYMIVD